jgi:rhodanese-related sulfurtransferase
MGGVVSLKVKCAVVVRGFVVVVDVRSGEETERWSGNVLGGCVKPWLKIVLGVDAVVGVVGSDSGG